ncbi:MAG: DUF11 domain-containing protein [Sphingomonadales bacterium]|nr:DUF11 domain-containing protein [Sphingomonadales bacterium]
MKPMTMRSFFAKAITGLLPVFAILAPVTAQAQNAVNTGHVAVPSGFFDPDTSNNDSTDTDVIDRVSDLTISKTDGVTSVNSGDSTTYTITVTNNGPSSVTGAILSDPVVAGLNVTAVACAGTPGQCVTAPSVAQLQSGTFALPTLASGQSYSITVTATVTAASGSLDNVATIAVPTGTTDPTPGDNSATDTNTVVPLPVLTLVKSVVNTGGGTAAASAWTLSATGPSTISGVTGNAAVTNATVSAGAYSLAETGGPSGYTASTYSCVVGAAPAVAGNSVALVHGDVATCTITNTFQPAPALTVVNSATPPATLAVGQKITYSFAVENTGNVQMTGIVVNDAQLDAAATCLATTLAPGATTSCSGEHTITQADIDAGGVPNSATVSGNPPTGPITTSMPSTTNTPIAAAPALTLDKQAPTGSLTVGSTLTYTVVATNAGNITQSAVTVSDPMLTPGSTTWQPGNAAPGARTLTGTYVVQQSDVDAGKLTHRFGRLDPGHNTGHHSVSTRSQQRLRSPSTSRRPPAASPSARPDLHGRRHQRGQHHPECGHGQRSHAHTGLDHLCNARSGRHAPSPVPMSSSRAMSTRARLTTPLRSPRPRSQHRSPTASRPRSQQRRAHPRQAGAHRQPHRRLDPDLHGRRHQRGQHHPECGHGQRSHAHRARPPVQRSLRAPHAPSPVPMSSSRAMSTRARLTTPLRSPRPRSQHRSPTASRPRSQQRLRSPSTSRRPPAASPSARP